MLIQPNNMITSVYRSLIIFDNRNNTLIFILDTIKKSFEELLSHLEKAQNNIFDLNISTNMIEDLSNCKIGLSNLKDTYVDDLMFCCKIDTIIQDIDARLEQIKSKYSFIKQKTNNINISQKTINITNTPKTDTTLQDSLPSSLSSIESIPGILTGVWKNK
jgi:hypothetical protein